ncbi:MAG: M3 family metallopeptidase, partial [Bacteroidales bacterium]
MIYFNIKSGRHTVVAMLLVFISLGISCDKNEKTMNNNPLLSEFNTPHHTVPFNDIKASDFEPAFEEAFKLGRKEISEIVNNADVPTFENTVAQLSNSGEKLGVIASILFNLNSAETNDSIQQIAMKISPKLTAYGNEINLNQKLFERVKSVYENCDRTKLSPEEITILEDTYKGFTRSGANLNDADKAEYKVLTEELSTLTVQFGQNVLAETNRYKMHISDEGKLAGLPADVKDAAKAKAKENDMDGWVFDLTAPSYMAFMKYADNRELRKELYEAYMSKSTKGDEYDNQDVVRKITSLRLEIAKLLGYDCYADYVLEDKMAKNKEGVYDLLNELLTAYKPAAINDYKEVNAYASKNGLKDEVQAWDWSYYSENLKEEMYSISDEETKPYFELEAVKKGVFGLATKLWGITFKENKDIQVYHPEVTAYEVFDKSGDFLA